MPELLLAVIAFMALPVGWGLWEEWRRIRRWEREHPAWWERDYDSMSDDWQPRIQARRGR